jgi:chromosome segregation ATPase
MIEYEVKKDGKIAIKTEHNVTIDDIEAQVGYFGRALDNLNAQRKQSIDTIENIKERIKSIDDSIRHTNADLIEYKRIKKQLNEQGIKHTCKKEHYKQQPDANTEKCYICGDIRDLKVK